MDNSLLKIQQDSESKIRSLFLSNKLKLPKAKYRNYIIHSKYLSEYSLQDKIILAKLRIKEFLDMLPNQDVVISFSGGKDSCVLKDLVWKVQDDFGLKKSKLLIGAEVFHPETAKFINSLPKNMYEILKPIKTFIQVIKENGYPIISKQIAQKIHHIRNTHNHSKYIRAIFGLDGNKYGTLPLKYIHFLDKKLVNYEVSHKCCDYIKGNVKHDKRPTFIGTTINESRLRRNSWLQYGCIHYDRTNKHDICKPLSLFSEKDIWEYVKTMKLKLSEIYKLGYLRSGCICCGFGMSLEEELKRHNKLVNNRFELLYKTNIKAFNYFFNKLKMWMPLADMNVSLNINDKRITSKFNKRKITILKWYRNINKNLKDILNEIEQRNPHCWNKREKQWILNKYSKALRI